VARRILQNNPFGRNRNIIRPRTSNVSSGRCIHDDLRAGDEVGNAAGIHNDQGVHEIGMALCIRSHA